MNKISKLQRIDIIDQYLKGYSLSQVGSKFNISPNGVRYILISENVPCRPTYTPRIYNLDESVFDYITNESAYWIGFLMADGGITNGNRIVISLHNRDLEHIIKFREFLKSNHPIKPQRDIYSRLEIRSKRLVDRLSTFGVVPNKSLIAKIEYLEYNKHFWRGVLDGDGCIYFAENKFCSSVGLCGSEFLISQFKNFMSTIISGSQASILPNKNIYTYKVTGNYAKQAIEYIYYAESPVLNRKSILARKVLEQYKEGE